MELSLIFGISILGLLFAVYLIRDVLKRDTGSSKMQEISNAIKQGAEAFLRRQNRTILWLALCLAAFIYIMYAFIRTPTIHDPASQAQLALWTTLSFVLGALCSVAAGYMGMWVAIRSNIRTAAAATKGMNGALQTALRGGAVSGFFVVAMSLLGVAGLFTLVDTFHVVTDVAKIPLLIVGYGFGASFVALFAQLGGGIYTKAADVGADLVGKVEAGIPEDDPRNAAVIADLVGDNVGDCAGRGADLFESTAAESIGAMILGVTIFNFARQQGAPNPEVWILFPLVVRAFGSIASMIGLMFVGGADENNPMKALNRGYFVSAALSAVFMVYVVQTMLDNLVFALAGLVGIATSIAFVYITQYYTSGNWRPVRQIAEASKGGPATNIVAGLAIGFETTASTALTIGSALLLSYWLGTTSGLPHGGIYATAVATMGMLMTCAYILSMDTFGPITDNAGGINEMTHAPAEARRITDSLDAVGNTTKALTKGYAIGSAALAAFLLFLSLIHIS